ncbi:hypothetical protein IFR05_000716 [Cadophora sp. M221]|nr:hypothetical protein IFR05_000716 [Cadophora sp. M221]
MSLTHKASKIPNLNFIQYCKDLQVLNEEFAIDRVAAEIALAETIGELHRVWCSGPGRNQDEIKRDMTKGTAVEKFWRRQAERFGDESLNVGGFGHADISQFVASNDTKVPSDIGNMPDTDFSFCSDVDENKKGTWKPEKEKTRTESAVRRDEELAELQMQLCRESAFGQKEMADMAAGVERLALGNVAFAETTDGEGMDVDD